MTNTDRAHGRAAAGWRAWCWGAVLAAVFACGPEGSEPGTGAVSASAREAGPAAAGAAAQPSRATTPAGTGGVNAPETLDKPYLVLVSFDGFRHDYLDRYPTPNFDRVAARGVTAEALVPVYPSLTFPAHYSIATGLRPERHGLVGNRFYDPARGDEYNYRDRASVEDGSWYGGEPIWVTAETQGMVAAALLLVGTEADVGGVRPTYWTPYAERGSQRERVDRLLGWLALPPERRPHLFTLYFSAVDGAGHRAGPASPAVAEAVGQVDAALGRLLDGIDALPHGDAVSVVLVSDHGMAAASLDAVIDLRAIADLRGVRALVGQPGANLFVAGGAARARAVRDDINDGTGGNVLEGGRAYLRREVPAALHYRADPRIGDVVVVAEPGVMFERGSSRPPAGMHGWDPRHPDMHGIFLASGPEIRPGQRIGPIESVHLYPFLSRLLRLAPNPDVDGDPAVLAPVLAPNR
jgi:predicted AlkP superfamily pyrophosphatase or phosphodiesterase